MKANKGFFDMGVNCTVRCRVRNCIENDNGYCMCSSYVEIDEDGTCSEITTKSDYDGLSLAEIKNRQGGYIQ